MVNNVVVGTLSTLSTLIAPLGPAAPAENQVYKFELEPNEMIQAKCHEGSQDERSKIGLKFEKAGDTYFTATVKVKLCTAEHGFRKVVQKLNLPIQLMDDAFLLGLPQNQGYVVSGIPSAQKAGQKYRVKITRLRTSSSLDPIRVEWIPDASGATESPPITLWLGSRPGTFATVKGFTTSSVHWRRIELSYKHPFLSKPFVMAGDLARIDQEQ